MLKEFEEYLGTFDVSMASSDYRVAMPDFYHEGTYLVSYSISQS